MNNPPAFPTNVHNHGDGKYASLGMTLRDYFAAKAIVAYHADGEYSPSEDVANWCYRIADAMMKEREA